MGYVRDIINAGFEPQQIPGPMFFLNQNNYFQFLVPKENTDNYNIEFSESLIKLFPFKHIKTSYGSCRLLFESENVVIGGKAFSQITCPVYDTIYPFTQLLFVSDNLGLNPINFINNSVLQSNLQTSIYENAILSYDIGTDLITSIYNFYKYVNENDTIWCNFKHNTSLDPNITIKIYLRLKNDLLIPYILGPNELFTFSLEIKYIE